ncbi:TonB-dependent receptor [Caulobacter flavus]|uniref:TonB-dependent receptor n=1 Tax=Caulobacter flavus TaxID=1679497 RepID=A0A2N5CZ30_9CAUL|nr:TonB-dependent receptor [Caulobacter flavus]AYV45255.1 TonB-dependent receptor [Caulobacter flavus]PLR19064.1 TonB-dependent receptor [Caulobacter flavus]
MKKTALLALCAIAPLALAAQAAAADVAPADAPIATADAPVTASEVVVQAQIAYRNRTEETAPVLEYGLDYFQRFEPLTAGDALKRVPSVAFLSDVLESDGVRLRGLDPAYTQILINGEKIPGAGSGSGAFGAGADGSFFVDRIPAELIERIEIVRSASANRSGDAVAGAINIVLRDAYALDGGFVRAGAMMFDDKRIRETVGGVWGGQVGPGRLLVGANIQGRRNPKQKLSLRYDEPNGTLDNSEVQTDVRNGTDYSVNASYQVPVAGGDLELAGFFVRTDRLQDEDSIEYAKDIRTSANIQTINNNDVQIDQDSWSLTGKYKREMLGGRTSVKLGYAGFKGKEDEFEDEIEYLRDAIPFPDGDRITRDKSRSKIDDTEFSAKVEHERDLSFGAELEFGLQYEKKERDTLFTEVPRNRYNLPATTVPAFGAYAPIAGGDASFEQTRLDPYVMLSGKSGALKWEAGLRYETTDVSIEDRTSGDTYDNDYKELLPSASLRYNLTDTDQLYAATARTVRRPSFEYLSPATLEAELGDNDFVGVPTLKPETAWGLDVGYERRLGRSGVAGVNVFYRKVNDLLELYNTGAEGSEGDGTFVYSARNAGDGKVWGVEFDLSTPLTFVGLDNTGVFLNYSWLDSDIDDEFGSRKFNSQSDYVLNVGFIQDLPTWGASFGATYRKQGEAYSRVVGEEVTTTYGGDLEIFVEKRIGKDITVRLTGSNLLDASKKESFNKFTTIEDQVDRSFDEYELEREQAGPVFQLIARMAF